MMDAPEIVTVHEAELVDSRQSGGRLRAFCNIPPHKGDHQRSLSIALEGDAAGYGFCHACGAKVFVPELAPQDGKARGSWRPRRVTAETLLRPPPRPVASDPTPAAWQRNELATPHRLPEPMAAPLADARPRPSLGVPGTPYHL